MVGRCRCHGGRASDQDSAVLVGALELGSHILTAEHLGMLDDPTDRIRLERKRAAYLAAGIRPHQDGGGPEGALTRDNLMAASMPRTLQGSLKRYSACERFNL